jgi:hypothetical protein
MRWIQNGELYKRLPMKHVSILPDEGFTARCIELSPGLYFPVYCDPKKPGRPVHRVKVMCSCGKTIPFGRMGQHYRTHTK